MFESYFSWNGFLLSVDSTKLWHGADDFIKTGGTAVVLQDMCQMGKLPLWSWLIVADETYSCEDDDKSPVNFIALLYRTKVLYFYLSEQELSEINLSFYLHLMLQCVRILVAYMFLP